jgi:Kef-type K+ transport system membrane component KefB
MPIELTFIPALLAILAAAGLGRLLSMKLRQPAIFGELLLGMILGHLIILSTTGPEAAAAPISAIAQIGILLLLFSTGLTLHFETLKRLEVASSVVAISGVILPFALGYFAAVFFGFPFHVAVFIGICLTATSVGVKASVLAQMRMLRTRLGALIMGAAVIDDVITVVIMSIFLSIFITGVVPLAEIFLFVTLAIFFLLLALTVGIKLLRELSERLSIGRESLLMFGLVMVLGASFLAAKIRLAGIIGAFVAGLVVGQTHYARRLRDHISLVGGGFFIPVFFVTMGMEFKLWEITAVSSFALVLVIVAIIGKVVGCGLAAKASKFSSAESFAVGVGMIPRAGVELIMLKLGLDYGVIPPAIAPGVASAILLMVMVTTFVTPPAFWKTLQMARSKRELITTAKFGWRRAP